ncbi:precorrin-6A synthase [Pseudochelatococcus lubricantis]|uniref:Precorrin-6A synthase [deacetylating] n=1 Tax=Pseudochelatococcus lubricantis TaxID=1538102 RepID=A0ABX0UZU8_9HYPH|nr:precorrin-6A synthase (deacetylating) [Pseudochelatococcus lubricantis]NIJ57898.1 precorrin-6A synthase [Pseudochelatococcus lubricantis]
MRHIVVIGIGSGNPEHMTVQGINALNRADIVLIPQKGEEKAELASLRRAICARYLTNPRTRLVPFDLPVRDAARADYREGVDDWHAAIAATYRTLLAAHLAEDGTAALLVWGDPSLYDSTLRIIERLRAGADFAIDHTVIPGIASPQALAASFRMPLNTIGGAVHVTTGRRLAREGFPDNADTALVMLDGDMSFRHLAGDDFDIFWGAYLGMADETVISGRLADVAETIAATRAGLRGRNGWIMDIYLLRRR